MRSLLLGLAMAALGVVRVLVATRWTQGDGRFALGAVAIALCLHVVFLVGFGLGPHQCLGMNVAKQEMIVALNALMNRFPNMRLDPAAPPPRIVGGLEQRGMSAIPVLLH